MTFLESKEVEPVKKVQMNIFQSNTYRKELSWLHFIDEPRVQERKQVFMFVLVAYPTIPSRKELRRMNQGSNFLGGSFSNSDNVRAPIQFEREGQPQHLKR